VFAYPPDLAGRRALNVVLIIATVCGHKLEDGVAARSEEFVERAGEKGDRLTNRKSMRHQERLFRFGGSA
jgi:hypothetical protein